MYIKTSANKFFSLMRVVFHSMSQIMLQTNIVTGLMFLLGIFIGMPLMGLMILLATITSTATAKVLRFNSIEINIGLYGFNAALVGAAAAFYVSPLLSVLIITVAGSIIATLLQHLFLRYNVKVFTLPFILVTWGFIYLINYCCKDQLIVHPPLPSDTKLIEFPFYAFGQIIFQNKLFIGVIFFAAVLFSSPIAALYGILCSMITLPTLFYFSYNETDIYNGMLSFNVVLCAITFAGKKMVDFLWAMLSSVIAICCSYILLKLNVAMLTFPFVVASCFTYYLKLFLDKKKTNKPTKG